MTPKAIRVSSTDRREQIIEVAVRLFSKKGFRGTTTREIADLADVNEAILFRHFPHKEDLYWAVVESKCHSSFSHKQFRDMLDAATPREALTAIAEEILQKNIDDPSLTRLYFYTALENHELSHRLFRTHALSFYEALEDYIRARIRRGEFRRVNPRLAARSFIGMIAQHYQVQELFGGKRLDKFDPHEVSQSLADIWLGGLTAPNGNHSRKKRTESLMTSSRARFPILLASLALTLFASACTTQTAQTAPSLAAPVTVAKAVQKTVPIQLTAIGAGNAYSTVSIESQVNAKLLDVHFTQGQFVKKGDLLFTLDARPFEASLAQAQGTLDRDKAQLELDKVQAARYSKLFAAGVTPKEQFDQVQATSDAQAEAVRSDEAAVESARLQLQYCKITSPLDGVTGALQVYPGNLVKQNDVPVLVVINQVSPIFVDFSIPEQYLGVVKKYMAGGRLQVEATPYGDTKPEVGVLSFINNAVDATTGTIKLKATFANADHRLWPGQFSTTSLRLAEEENATVVPSQAVQQGQQGDFVYVVTSDMTAQTRPVKIARTIGGESVVAQGVKPGETVVTDGQLRLLPGIKVQIKNSGAGN